MFHVYQTIVASLIDIVQIIELMLTFLIDIDHMRAACTLNLSFEIAQFLIISVLLNKYRSNVSQNSLLRFLVYDCLRLFFVSQN